MIWNRREGEHIDMRKDNKTQMQDISSLGNLTGHREQHQTETIKIKQNAKLDRIKTLS